MVQSNVWVYMTRINNREVKCNKCNKIFQNPKGGSTSSLRNHLQKVEGIACPTPKSGSRKRAHSETETVDLDSDADDPAGESAARVEATTPAAKQRAAPAPARRTPTPSTPKTSNDNGGIFKGPMDRCLNNASSFAPGGARYEECTDGLLFAIAKDNMPLSVTERPGFRVFVRRLQSQYKPPSEPNITKRLGEKHKQLKEQVKQELQEAPCIILTLDIWTQKGTMRSYLGITVHYPLGTEMKSVEAGVMRLMERKRIPYLRTKIQEFCADWGIDKKKVAAAISDGGANIKGALKEEFPGRHISCIGHLLDNIGQKVMRPRQAYVVPSERETEDAPAAQAQQGPDLPDRESDIEDEEDFDDAIENSLLREVIVKVKKVVRFFRQSEVATTELTKLQMEENGVPEARTLKLIQEVKTRWNSCFAMLDRFLQLQEMVARLILKLQRDKNSKSKPPEILTMDEIDALTEVRDLLRPLDIATKEVSKEKFPTLSKCIPLVKALRSTVEKQKPVTPVGFNLKADLKARLSNAFGKIEELRLYQCATILDPRFKKAAFASAQCAASAEAYVASQVKKHTIEKLGAAAAAEPQVVEPQQGEAQALSDLDDFWGSVDEAAQQAGCVARTAAANAAADVANAIGYSAEFRAYMNAAPVDRKSTPNPLQAWEDIKHLYPNVYEVAMKYLPILSSSIPCERLFSHAGLISNQLRNRLSGKNLDILIFLRSLSEDEWFRK